MKPVFYDSDVLSCFLAIHDVSILKQLFDKVFIPYEVFNELVKASFLAADLNQLINEGFIEIKDRNPDSEEQKLFSSLVYGYEFDREIGKGEAAAITLAVFHNGILASNNTRDIVEAIRKLNISRIKTGDILVKAYNEGIIDEKEANEIWKEMLAKNRYLTAESFSDYLKGNPKSLF